MSAGPEVAEATRLPPLPELAGDPSSRELGRRPPVHRILVLQIGDLGNLLDRPVANGAPWFRAATKRGIPPLVLSTADPIVMAVGGGKAPQFASLNACRTWSDHRERPGLTLLSGVRRAPGHLPGAHGRALHEALRGLRASQSHPPPTKGFPLPPAPWRGSRPCRCGSSSWGSIPS